MTETKHTPGPWKLLAVGDGTSRMCPAGEDGVSLLTIVDEDGGDFAAVWYDADARLIVAAPDLLLELKRLMLAYVRLLESGRDAIRSAGGDCDPVDVMERNDPSLKLARDAIAKAEGRAKE